MEKLIGKLLHEGHITSHEAIELLSAIEMLRIEGDKRIEEINKKIEEIKNPSPSQVPLPKDLKDFLDVIKQREERRKFDTHPFRKFDTHPFKPFENFPKTYSDICSCNPKQGGDGVCFCIMGNKPLTGDDTKQWFITTATYCPKFDDDDFARKGEGV